MFSFNKDINLDIPDLLSLLLFGDINPFICELDGTFIFINFNVGKMILFIDFIWFSNFSLTEENDVFNIFNIFWKFNTE